MDKGRQVTDEQIKEACRRAGVENLTPTQRAYLTHMRRHGFWVSGRASGKTTVLRVAVELDKLLDEKWTPSSDLRVEVVVQALKEKHGISPGAATPWFDELAEAAVDALEDEGWFDR